MIELTSHEAGLVFKALIPNFRVNARGEYRGPAKYGGGNNPIAFAITPRNGVRFFDHATGEGGDTVAYVQGHLGLDFRRACRAISEIIGREMLKRDDSFRPSFSREVRTQAELFRVGLIRHIELTNQYIKWLLAQDFVTADVKAAIKAEQVRLAGTATPPVNITGTSVSDDIALEIGCAIIAAVRAKGVTL
jgi:hypothetical protein